MEGIVADLLLGLNLVVSQTLVRQPFHDTRDFHVTAGQRVFSRIY